MPGGPEDSDRTGHDATGTGLRASDNTLGVDGIEASVENESGTVLFFPERGVDRLVEREGLERAAGRLPERDSELRRRIEDADGEMDYLCTVRSTYEKSGLVRTKQVEETHHYDLRYLAEAVEHVDADRDLLAAGEVWVPVRDSFPLVARFPASPPELVSVRSHGEVRELDPFETTGLDDPCGCAVTPTFRVDGE